MTTPALISRRRFIASTVVGAGAVALVAARATRAQTGNAPAVITRDPARPQLPSGVMTGDVSGDRAVVGSRTDRPTRLVVEYATSDAFKNARRVIGPAALAETDFTARIDLSGLPAGQDIFYRAAFQDLSDPKVMSAPA